MHRARGSIPSVLSNKRADKIKLKKNQESAEYASGGWDGMGSDSHRSNDTDDRQQNDLTRECQAVRDGH